MSRLPDVGGDDNTWGGILNDFLGVEHNADGTLKKAADIADAKAKADAAETPTGAQSKVDTHAALTTTAHGGLVAADDSRLDALGGNLLGRQAPLWLGMAPATWVTPELEAINTQLAPKKLDMVLFYQAFPSEPLLYASNYATCSTLNLIPSISRAPTSPIHSYTDGSQDSVLNSDADTAKADGRLILCRLAAEFNGNWNAYGSTKETAAEFVTGWKYMVDKLRARGAKNIQFVWNPNVWAGGASTVDPTPFFPGDDYVDYISLDGYMNLKSGVVSFEDVFLDNYNTLTQLSTKPFIIGETGVAEDARVDKAQWFRDMFACIRDKMPRCVALQYWDRDSTPAGEGDYTLDSSGTNTAALSAFRGGVNTFPFVSKFAEQPDSRSWIMDFWKPTGALAENYPRMLVQAFDLQPASGTLYLFAGPYLKKGIPINSITMVSGNTDGVGVSHLWFCLVDASNLAVLAKTTDDTAWSSFSSKTLNLASPYTPANDVQTYFGVCAVAGTTPSLRGFNSYNSVTAAIVPKMMGNSTTGLTTPASLGSAAAAITNNTGIIPYGYVS